ncbi:MAG: HAMP domain-containing protein [Gammaproteobacteria bacterium]|nr:HAMP domain-containing protein [Gammaproteobacteria bacterium]
MVTALIKRIPVGVAPFAALLLLLLSLFMMSASTQNSTQFGRLYPTLLVINVLVLLLLCVFISINILRLYRQYRNKATGSRLTVRLVAMFVILTLMPVSVVYYFSLDFLRRGIDSWFDVSTEHALEDALELGRTALDERMRGLRKKSERVVDELTLISDSEAVHALDTLRRQIGASELTLFSRRGYKIIAFSNENPASILPTSLPNGAIILQLRGGNPYMATETVNDNDFIVRMVIEAPPYEAAGDPRVLQVIYPVDRRISELAETVQTAFTEYKKLDYFREPLKLSFTLTLSMVLLLTLLTAVWAAFYSARRLVEPIRTLAIGTRAVASGDYTQRLPQSSNDELGFLVRSFNTMTEGIAKARDDADLSRSQAERQRAYLSAVLGRLTSGVITFDRRRDVRTSSISQQQALQQRRQQSTSPPLLRMTNNAAAQILGVDVEAKVGQSLSSLSKGHPHLQHFVDAIEPLLTRSDQEWREEIALLGPTGRVTLICRGMPLPCEEHEVNAGYVIVFDDVTALIQAQRDAAWSEAARRLAHEIKNPLTPIRLSAERLRHKYLKTMNKEDAEVLDRSTHTIVQQVEVMKEMVTVFSEYAHTTKLQLRPLDLNVLVNEVLDLYRGYQVPVEAQLATSLPQVSADAGRLRQLLHNLIKNAMQAMVGHEDAQVMVHSRCVAQSGFQYIELRISDRGPGFPDDMIAKAFEPYVTSKPKGSGLGLAIVKKIVEEHNGVVWVENGTEGGASVVIRLPTDAAAE